MAMLFCDTDADTTTWRCSSTYNQQLIAVRGLAQMSVTMMAATLLRHFRFEAIHPNTPDIPCDYDITVRASVAMTKPTLALPRSALYCVLLVLHYMQH